MNAKFQVSFFISDGAKSNVNGAWEDFVKKISHVKAQVMEHIEENEEARLNAADIFINNSITGQFIDPEGEKENNEDHLDKVVREEDFQHLDPEFAMIASENLFEETFRPIKVRPSQEVRAEAKKLYLIQKDIIGLKMKLLFRGR